MNRLHRLLTPLTALFATVAALALVKPACARDDVTAGPDAWGFCVGLGATSQPKYLGIGSQSMSADHRDGPSVRPAAASRRCD